MNELDAAIYTRLSTTSGVTSLLATPTSIYHLQAVEGAAYPYIVFSTQGGGDLNLSKHRLKSILVFVRAYSKSSAMQSGAIDSAIDAALHNAPLTISGWSNLWLAREQDLELVETQPNNIRIWMNGGLYRVTAEKT